MRTPRYAAGAAVVAALLLLPYSAAFAQDVPVVEPPAAEPPSAEPPVIPGSPVDNPPLVSPPVEIPPSTMPEGEFDFGESPPYVPPVIDVSGMSDAERLAYLLSLAQHEIDVGLQQWAADFLASRGGSGSGAGSTVEPAAVAAATAAATAADGSWIQLTKTIVDRGMIHPGSDSLGARALSSRLVIRYETPLTTELSFVVVNGSPNSTSVTVTWTSESGTVTERIRVESGATLQSVLALPKLQDLAAHPGRVTARFTAPADSRDTISFVALASSTLPQDLPESRGYAPARSR